MSERDEQIAVFSWAERVKGRWPELALMFHVPNERKCTPQQGALLKAQGVKAGVPDIWLPVARGGYNGLVIELKYGKNRPTPTQRQWLDALAAQGWFAAVCWKFEDAVKIITAYLSGQISPVSNSDNEGEDRETWW